MFKICEDDLSDEQVRALLALHYVGNYSAKFWGNTFFTCGGSVSSRNVRRRE
jgi:hypothetical protein